MAGAGGGGGGGAGEHELYFLPAADLADLLAAAEDGRADAAALLKALGRSKAWLLRWVGSKREAPPPPFSPPGVGLTFFCFSLGG